MNLRRDSLPTLLIAATLLAGCRCPSSSRTPCANVAPCVYEQTAPLHHAPDLTELASIDRDALFLFPCQLPSPSDEYRLIDAPTAGCNAARNARVAYMLDLEQHWASILIDCDTDAVQKALCLTRDLLKLREADVRNAAAGSALTTFYMLAGAETQLTYVRRGVEEARATLRRIDALRQKGLEVPAEVNRAEVAQMLAGLEDQELQLSLARIQLNGQLMRLLGCPLNENGMFQPSVDWSCQLSNPDFEALAADGLAHRSDVRSVRLAACRLEKATLPVARAVLAVADPALGSVEPQSGLCHLIRCSCCYDQEEPIRRRQLRTLLAESREAAIAKIKGAAFQVAIQQQRVAVARQAVLDRRGDLRSLEKLRDVNDTSIFEISTARGRVFTAEATLVEQVVELKVAEVALRQEQGLLADECGLGAHLCCEPQSNYEVRPVELPCPTGDSCPCEAELEIPISL
ncbi:hypothetical protein Pla123a_46640 [Posidoniimonas polymericola]|uniref:Outer membrane efflux protein n=1 Tax=Posidoniimonas polymericola TaxID=2528002 RepID=A0A5C5XXY6_9BACT|nr:hypothetical protein [Posidoniimonas polymericola]TWT66775.1 hypothetical protein Pla123a_46640 [Posidoniimonas polymericola]